MKFCPTCGKELQYDAAEICPGCGCRVMTVQRGGGIGSDRIIVIILAAIFIILCIIAIGLHGVPQSTPAPAAVTFVASNPSALHSDNSLSVEWNSMDDWKEWKHSSTWSGPETGPCTEYGPKIVSGHGEYGADVHLQSGTMESSILRTFADPSGTGWNTLTLVGRLSPSDGPAGRWMKIEVNNNVVFDADATQFPPGNGIVFTIPVHFTQSKTVSVKISHGQTNINGGSPGVIDYHSLRLSTEKSVGM